MTTQQTGIEALLLDIGLNKLTDCVLGCAYIAVAMDGLSLKDRTLVHARLTECLQDTNGNLSLLTKLQVEVVANNLARLNASPPALPYTYDRLRNRLPLSQITLYLKAKKSRGLNQRTDTRSQ
jgi:hypothetical protein